MTIDEKLIERIVQQVTQELNGGGSTATAASAPAGSSTELKYLYDDIDEAVNAAYAAQREFLKFRIEDRKRITDSIKSLCMAHAEELAKMELEETHYGNYPDKLMKMKGAITMTPSVEDIVADINANDGGMAMYEHAPFRCYRRADTVDESTGNCNCKLYHDAGRRKLCRIQYPSGRVQVFQPRGRAGGRGD